MQIEVNQIKLISKLIKNQSTDLLRLIIKRKALINFLTVQLQHRFLKSAYVSGYPYYLTIEPGNVCQLKCVLCPTGQREEGLPKGFLNFTNFKKIIDELGDYLYIVELYN